MAWGKKKKSWLDLMVQVAPYLIAGVAYAKSSIAERTAEKAERRAKDAEEMAKNHVH